ncbi:hypothetical protein [Komagataeibacter sp. FNDCF1]|uniref:hypothetical protein n=1 Tax=Komagataeibacter sp. FNDCF1 TaxID=2878681 RepID=UPI001E4697A0|nr:hypothetical protein [Komagataeibacter sp. FNDCF1]MCE2564152.1 hypothetical protein [Komagataeibacter sp. FNDCF1]
MADRMGGRAGVDTVAVRQAADMVAQWVDRADPVAVAQAAWAGQVAPDSWGRDCGSPTCDNAGFVIEKWVGNRFFLPSHPVACLRPSHIWGVRPTFHAGQEVAMTTMGTRYRTSGGPERSSAIRAMDLVGIGMVLLTLVLWLSLAFW